MGESAQKVVAVANLREFFRDSVHGALEKQHVSVEAQTEQYVVNVLTLFSRSEALFADTPPGAPLKPLAFMLRDALEAPTPATRNHMLQRLGDVSLFIAGFFARGFAAKLIDIDYHIAMGGRAYGTLADASARRGGRTLAQVFAELAQKFQPLVDALNEVSETSYTHSDRDILRLYEVWLKTGSARCHGLLRRLGVDPTHPGRSALAH